MRLATIKLHGAEIAGIVTGKGILPVAALNAYKGTGWKEDMMSLIQANHIPGLTRWYNEGGKEELETIPGVVPNLQGDYNLFDARLSAHFGQTRVTVFGSNLADERGVTRSVSEVNGLGQGIVRPRTFGVTLNWSL